MTAYMISAVVAGLVMVMGAGVFYGGYRVGLAAGQDRSDDRRFRALDPEDRIGRLPSEVDERAVGESTGRHHFVPPSDDHTESFAPVVRPDDLLADDDSIPGKKLRDFYRQPQLRWPDDMELAERQSISADSYFERTVDAASGMEDR